MAGHSLEYFSTINSLAEEGLLKKYVVKRNQGTGDSGAAGAAGAGEDLTCVSYKCNFDHNWIKEVSDKIVFQLEEYLVANEVKEE